MTLLPTMFLIVYMLALQNVQFTYKLSFPAFGTHFTYDNVLKRPSLLALHSVKTWKNSYIYDYFKVQERNVSYSAERE